MTESMTPRPDPPRPRSKPVSMSIDSDNLEWLSEQRATFGIPSSRLVNRALRELRASHVPIAPAVCFNHP